MELMQKALEKTQRFDDYLATMGGITKEEPSQLPPKFSILEADRFAGVGDPKQHLRQYLNFVKIKRLNEEQVLRAFSLSLAKSTSNWYYTLNVWQTKNLGVLVEFFIDQFSYNTMINVNLSDVETTRQRENGTFSEFLVH